MTTASAVAIQVTPLARERADRIFDLACLWIPAAALLLFFVYPIGMMGYRSLLLPDGSLGFGNFSQIIGSRSFLKALFNSLSMGLATTAVTVGLGLLLAFALHRCRIWLRLVLLGAISLPVIAPSLVQGLGLIFLLGRNGLINKTFGLQIEIYGFWGLLIANTLYALPQAAMIIGAALRNADARLFEAAEVMGASGWRRFIDLTLPNIRFGLLSATFVVFTVTITDFGNAAVIGGDYTVLAIEIYNQVIGQMNLNLGAVVGMLLLLPTVLAFYFERLATQRQFGTQSEAAVPYRPGRDPWRDGIIGTLAWLVALAPVTVVGVVVYASFMRLWPYRLDFTLRHYDIKLAGGYDPLWISIGISAAAAGFGTIFLLFLGVALKRMSGPAARAIYFVSMLPAAVPGLVLGLAYVFAFNQPGTPLILLYGSATLLAMCNFYHYHTQGFATMTTGLRQIPPALEEAATCIGASAWAVLRDVYIPYTLPTLISVFFFLFMSSMVTLSAVIFLVTPKLMLAAVTVMRLDEAGFTAQAAAFSTAIMLVVTAALLLARGTLWLAQRRIRLPTEA
jgi:iron(III) transport system permease protein